VNGTRTGVPGKWARGVNGFVKEVVGSIREVNGRINEVNGDALLVRSSSGGGDREQLLGEQGDGEGTPPLSESTGTPSQSSQVT